MMASLASFNSDRVAIFFHTWGYLIHLSENVWPLFVDYMFMSTYVCLTLVPERLGILNAISKTNHRADALDAVKETGIVDGNVLLGDDLDNLLRNKTPCQS